MADTAPSGVAERLAGSSPAPGPYLPEIAFDVAIPETPELAKPEPVLTAAAVSGVLTEDQVVALLREAGAPEEWIPDLVSISECESHHSPFAVGDSGNSLGQYQLWSGWARPAGFTAEELFDPLVNAKVAVYVRSVRGRFGGPGGWTCADILGLY